MREILFRGKRVDNGSWETGSLVVVRGETSDEKVFVADKMTGYLTPVAPETAGQYTGLADKNGKKIFEGDVCRNTKTNETVSVKWHGTMSGFVWSKQKEKSHLFSFGELFRANDKYEIIGNTHDNPELLGGADNGV